MFQKVNKKIKKKSVEKSIFADMLVAEDSLLSPIQYIDICMPSISIAKLASTTF